MTRPTDEELRALLDLEAKVPLAWTYDKTSVRINDEWESVNVDPVVGILHVYRMKDDKRRKAIVGLIVESRNQIRAIVEELLERRAAQSAYPSADVLVRLPQEDVNND